MQCLGELQHTEPRRDFPLSSFSDLYNPRASLQLRFANEPFARAKAREILLGVSLDGFALMDRVYIGCYMIFLMYCICFNFTTRLLFLDYFDLFFMTDS